MMKSGASSNLVLSSLVFEYGCDAIILLDSERLVRALNPAARALLGWRDDVAGRLECRGALGCQPGRMRLGDIAGPGTCLCERVLALHRPVEAVKLRLRPHGRREIVVSASCSPLPVDHLGGAVLVLRVVDTSDDPLAAGDLRLGELHMDVARHQVHVTGRAIHLTPIEFDLLRHLLANAGRVIGRQELLEHIWKYHDVDDRHLIKSHIGSLRHRLSEAGLQEVRLENIYGVGYMLSGGAPLSAESGAAAKPKRDEAGDWW